MDRKKCMAPEISVSEQKDQTSFLETGGGQNQFTLAVNRQNLLVKDIQ